MKQHCIKVFLLLYFILFFIEGKSQTLLSESFEGSFPPSGWTLTNVGGRPWTQNSIYAINGTKCMECVNAVGDNSNSNAWAFTPALSLSTNTFYSVSYFYQASYSQAGNRMKVTMGNSASIAGQSTLIHDYNNVSIGSFVQGIDTISVTANGTYYFAFNCYNVMFGGSGLRVDSVVIKQLVPSACTGVPFVGTASSVQIAASGSVFPLNLSGNYSIYTGIQFQWQSSLQGANNYQNIPGAVAQNASTSQTAARDYRCVISCANGGTSVNTNSITVNLPNSGSMFRVKFNPGSDINKMIYGMSFLNPSTGFVAFADAVGYTQDSGQSYIRRTPTTGNTNYNSYPVNLTFGFSLKGVHAFSTDSLLIYGDYGAEPAILFSANQGINWKVIFHQPFSLNPDIGNSFFDMKFSTGSNGIAINQKYIVETADKGQNWTVTLQIPSYRTSKFSKISIPTTANAFAIAGNYLYRKSGSSWQELLYPLNPNGVLSYNTLSFTSASKGYFTNDENGAVYKTNDGGNTWAPVNDTLLNPVWASDMVFLNDSIGYIASKLNYNVLKTTDYGVTWELCKRNSSFQTANYEMKRLFFLNNLTAWAGGRGEYLMITTSAGNPTIPKSLFKIDTTNLTPTGNVDLISLSKPYYQHSWYKNGILISTSVNASYVHDILVPRDTIRLIVNNGTDSDSLVLYQDFPIPVFPAPVISSFNPTAGINGTTVTITGSNFYYTSVVSFGGIPALSFVVNSANSISAVVGAGTSGQVKVVTFSGKDSLSGFVHNGPPAILSFYPNTGGPGTPISIYGLNFTNLFAVSFGGTAALSYQVVSPTLIRAFVANGNSGNVSLTTNNGTANANGFTFIPRPTIVSFSPRSGPIGTTVTITGTNFSTQTDSNFVFFGAVKATVLSATTGSLNVKVPLGTSYAPLTVTTNGLTAFSNDPFTVTFTGGGTAFLSGSFADRVEYPAQYSPWNVRLKDLDGNGKPELLSGNEDGYVSTYKNNSSIGTLLFAPHTNYQTGGAAYNLATADLNGDGKPDVVSANNTGGNASILRNSSSLNNISFADKINLAVGHQARSAVIADFNLDGKPDIAISNHDANIGDYYMVSMYRNTGYKDTISFDAKIDIPSAGVFISAADFDGDGKTDIVTNTIAFLKNNSTLGNFSFNLIESFSDGDYGQITVGDINGDNKPDVVATKNSSNYVAIFINNSTVGTISFLPKISLVVGNLPYGIALTDLDGDGKIDIAVITNNTNTINGERTLVLKNNTVSGLVSFASAVEYYTPGAKATNDIVDLDMDGKPDIAYVSGFGYVSILRNKVGENTNLCPGGNASLSSNISGASYQWQLSTNNTTFNNISNNANYNNVNTNLLSLTNIPSGWYGYQYRCLVDGNYSEKFTIGFSNTWTGAVNNVWENPANWSCGTVPDSNTDVKILSGTIVISSNAVIRSLQINPTVVFTVNTGYNLTITH